MVLTVVLMVACKPQQEMTNVSIKNNSNRDVLQLSSTGYGKTEEEARFDAYKRALDVILFRGFPQGSSPLRDPMIVNKNAALEANKDFFDNLYSNQLFDELILSNSQIGNAEKQGGRYESTQNITFNLRLLRNRLEDAKIIKKFGI